jgi:hypothetical protein
MGHFFEKNQLAMPRWTLELVAAFALHTARTPRMKTPVIKLSNKDANSM